MKRQLIENKIQRKRGIEKGGRETEREKRERDKERKIERKRGTDKGERERDRERERK